MREDFEFIKTDAGRSKSKRPKQQNDCSVRSMALSTGLSYDLCYDFLKTVYHRKSHQGACFPSKGNDVELHLIDEDGKPRIYEYRWKPFLDDEQVGYPEFVKANPKGTFVIRELNHVSVVIDGKLYDDYRAAKNIRIFAYWIVKRIK